MKRSLLLLAVLMPCAHAQAPAVPPPRKPAATGTPALNWMLPIFTDKEGYRSMTLQGAEVRPLGEMLAVKDLHITLFSGDAAARVDAVLMSEAATFFPKSERATGEGLVRLVRDDADISGHGWDYDHPGKKISLKRSVRVVLQAQLNDVLK